MPRRVTSPKRKPKMASKARIPRGSKEAKEWNLKMQEAKRKKREKRLKAEKRKRKTSPVKKKKMSGKKKLDTPPFSHGTILHKRS